LNARCSAPSLHKSPTEHPDLEILSVNLKLGFVNVGNKYGRSRTGGENGGRSTMPLEQVKDELLQASSAVREFKLFEAYHLYS
jgi:hypothetical protein